MTTKGRKCKQGKREAFEKTQTRKGKVKESSKEKW
jgi:hypothetical protein